jgi:hypothetical protein
LEEVSIGVQRDVRIVCLCTGQKTTWKLNEEQFQQNQKLVLKYVDNKEALELQCLYAVQSLVHKLEHPQGELHLQNFENAFIGHKICGAFF